MSKNEKLRNIIYHCVEDSFSADTLSAKKVEQYTKAFKSFSLDKALLYLKSYFAGIEKYLADKTLFIESAVALDSAQVKRLSNHFINKYKVIDTKLKVDPSLLGGIRIKIGDVVIDNTVIGKIQQLGEAIALGK